MRVSSASCRLCPGVRRRSVHSYAAESVHAFNLRITQTGHIVPKPNYSYAKRQRELAKKQKKEEKRRQKALANQEPETDPDAPAQEPESATPQPDSEA